MDAQKVWCISRESVCVAREKENHAWSDDRMRRRSTDDAIGNLGGAMLKINAEGEVISGTRAERLKRRWKIDRKSERLRICRSHVSSGGTGMRSYTSRAQRSLAGNYVLEQRRGCGTTRGEASAASHKNVGSSMSLCGLSLKSLVGPPGPALPPNQFLAGEF